MIRALLWKEWREQRWRFALTALVLTALSAGLVRAQLMTTPEAVLFIFGPLGLVLTIFLAMGTVATEREDGTWDFLIAQPTQMATILRAKWAIGAASLVTALLLAGVAAHLAAESRGLFSIRLPPPEIARDVGKPSFMDNSAAGLWTVTGASLLALTATYSVFFAILSRARAELHAGLGGILVSIALLAWLAQYAAGRMSEGWIDARLATVLSVFALGNPLSPFLALIDSTEARISTTLVAVAWIGLGLWLAPRFAGERQ